VRTPVTARSPRAGGPRAATLAQRDALARCLEAGGVALFGADTVYGLCCDPLSDAAVARMFSLKGRERTRPAAVAFFSVAAALAALPELGEHTRAAFAALLPGPLTLLVPNPARRFPNAGGELLGVRVIDIGIDLDRPVLQSSANLTGGRDPRTLDEVPPAIRSAVDLELDRGPLPGTPSTVIDMAGYELDRSWRVTRAGPCTGAEVALALVGSRP
jgi:L-threonylcarbamoyladenylate synthase